MIILIVMIVNASQTTQKMDLMFVIKQMVSVFVRKTMTTGLAMNVQMGTLVILIAKNVTVNLVTLNLLYVIKRMEHANV